jgi:hypothetical protein
VNPGHPTAHPRIVLVGARQARHGLGPHLARHLARSGAEIVAVVGSRLATAQQAAQALEGSLGHRPIPLAHADDVERLPDLHAVAIASPHETHEAWLRWAVGRGLHALCEKPLVRGGPEPVTAAGALARRFAQRGLHLTVLAQWPLALPAFARLFPDVRFERVGRLELELHPPSRGTAMLPDALPHALSLAYALAPHERPRLEAIEGAFDDDDGSRAHVAWTHVAGARRLRIDVTLAQGGASPRGFSMRLDGRAARREVDPATYTMRLVDGTRSVPLEDPFAALAARFVARLQGGLPPEPDPSALFGVAHLQELERALPALPVTEIPYP